MLVVVLEALSRPPPSPLKSHATSSSNFAHSSIRPVRHTQCPVPCHLFPCPTSNQITFSRSHQNSMRCVGARKRDGQYRNKKRASLPEDKNVVLINPSRDWTYERMGLSTRPCWCLGDPSPSTEMDLIHPSASWGLLRTTANTLMQVSTYGKQI